MSLPYFKHHPQDYLHDSRILKLSYEDRGLYWQIINEMWSSKIMLPDDDEFISLLLRIRVEKWLEVKKRLMVGATPLIKSIHGYLVSPELQSKFGRAEEYSLAQAIKRAKNKEPKVRKIKHF